MMKCVGNYGYKLPSTAVSQTIKEGANPAIANLNNKRFCLFQEPDRKNRICCSTIKEITGDKELNCRTLYSTDTLTRLKCSLLGEFNDLPALDESGDAMGIVTHWPSSHDNDSNAPRDTRVSFKITT